MSKEMNFEKRNKVYRLTNLLGITDKLDSTLKQSIKQNRELLEKQTKEVNADVSEEEIQRTLNEYDYICKRTSEKIDYTEMIDVLAELYYSNLTEEEVSGLVEFFESDLGKKWVSLQYKISPEIARLLAEWQQKATKITMEMLEDPDVYEKFDNPDTNADNDDV